MQQDYDLLLEDEVEFIQALHMPGTEKDRKASPPPQVKALQTIQETKKSLPIYPFKNDLIQAIKDHQVFYYYALLLFMHILILFKISADN